jgi:sulfoxide reductase heme-binding subunit YedZ
MNTESPLLWYLNRSTGLVLLVLLTATTVLGVLAMGGTPGRGLPRFVTQALHRNLALVSVVALAAHVLTAVADTFVDIRWWHALVPVGATYEPLWLGLGTLALDLILVVVVTSLLRTRLGYRTWRGIHGLSWLAWVLAVAHTSGIGTDVRDGSGWAVLPTLLCVLAVAAAAGLRLVRLLDDRPRPSRRTT